MHNVAHDELIQVVHRLLDALYNVETKSKQTSQKHRNTKTNITKTSKYKNKQTENVPNDDLVQIVNCLLKALCFLVRARASQQRHNIGGVACSAFEGA
jgi:hypothetical protein